MNSDTESLAFLEEDLSFPVAGSRSGEQTSIAPLSGGNSAAHVALVTPSHGAPGGLSTPCKPPLHNASSTVHRRGVYPTPASVLTPKSMRLDRNHGADSSDDESIQFMTENNSIAWNPGTSADGIGLTQHQQQQLKLTQHNMFPTSDLVGKKVLSNTSSSSIQFHSDGESRLESPIPTKHGKSFRGRKDGMERPSNATPSAPLVSSGEYQHSSVQGSSRRPDDIQRDAEKPRSSIANDSIVFFMEDDMRGSRRASQSVAMVPQPHSFVQGGGEKRPMKCIAGGPGGVGGASMDCSSIVFSMDDRSDSGATARHSNTSPSVPRPRNSTSPGRPSSRPLSPSIQFELDATDVESATGHSTPQSVNSISFDAATLPTFARQASTVTSPARTDSGALAPGRENSGESERQKKTVVTNRLHRSQKAASHHRPKTRQQQQHGKNGSHAPTHPPLYQDPPHDDVLGPVARDPPKKKQLRTSRELNLPKKKSDKTLRQSGASSSEVLANSFVVDGQQLSSSSPPDQALTAPRNRGSLPSQDPTDSPSSPLQNNQTLYSIPMISSSIDVGAQKGHGTVALTYPAASRTSPTLPAFGSSPHQGGSAFDNAHDIDADVFLGAHHRAADEADYKNSLFHRSSEQASAFFDPRDVHKAAMETAEWKAFNDQQRAELQRLKERISIAKRQDRTLLEKESPLKSRAVAPQPTPQTTRGQGAKAAFAPPSGSYRALARSIPSQSTSGTAVKSARNVTPPTSVWPPPKEPTSDTVVNSSYAKRTATAANGVFHHAHPEHSNARGQSPAPTTPSYNFGEAAPVVAELLGILWPPRGCGISDTASVHQKLYFVNGSRLTVAQAESFFEMVRIQEDQRKTRESTPQVKASSRDGVQSVSIPVKLGRSYSPRGAGTVGSLMSSPSSACMITPSSASAANGRGLLGPKKRIRRSQVLREVFDLLDVRREGCLRVAYIPVLARLLEKELVTLERRLSALSTDEVPLVASLLESAIACRKEFTTAWNGYGRRAPLPDAPVEVVPPPRAKTGVPASLQSPQDDTAIVHNLLLASFAVNVALPIISVGYITILDYATFCMVVYAAIQSAEARHNDMKRTEWLKVVHQYFSLLS